MARDYTKYNVEGLGENLNKRQLVFSKTNSPSGNGKYYRLEPMDFTPTGRVNVWTKNGKVSSVTYY